MDDRYIPQGRDILMDKSTASKPYERLLIQMGYSDLLVADTNSLDDFYDNPCAETLKHVGKKIQTREMVISAIKGEIEHRIYPWRSPILKFVSKRLLTRRICEMACYQCGDNLKYIPNAMITDEMRRIAQQEKEKEERECEQFWNDLQEEACDNLVEKSEETVDTRLLSSDVTPVSLTIPNAVKPEMMISSDNHIALCYEFEDLSDKSTILVYYISDIHLEHQLDLMNKTISDVKRLIQEKISELFDSISIQDKPGIILIGGDTAHSVEIEQIFFSELRERFSGMHIISVLGNHELWDNNPIQGSTRQIDEIIADYKNIQEATFLENALWIKYQGRVPIQVNEDILLSADNEELSGLCKQASVIILGGIGFSALNPIFNASSGIYRKAISYQEDINRSEHFRAVYNKVLQCAKNQKVIVLTHMPMSDWSQDSYNPNWVYINGHTHQNTLIKEKGITVLADNQVGYKKTTWHFNCFTMSNCYDPFLEYEEGIYQITPAQYCEFNRAQGIGMQFKSIDPVFLVKRDGTYMFFQRRGSVYYMLSGGKAQKVEHDIEYYFDNLIQYKSNVKKAFESYNMALRAISKEIKKFGGSGSIHGCIVDIDYWNHIYVNPFDGSITPYYALSMEKKYTYKTVEALLSASATKPHFSEKDTLESKKLLKNFRQISSKGGLPVLSSERKKNKMELAKVPELVLDMDMYDPSRIMRSIQYIFDRNIIRIWKDEILNLPTKAKQIDDGIIKKIQ